MEYKTAQEIFNKYTYIQNNNNNTYKPIKI